jgi:hypothetical protein
LAHALRIVSAGVDLDVRPDLWTSARSALAAASPPPSIPSFALSAASTTPSGCTPRW